MKRLTLLRHAKSSWNDPTLSDADRPLNKRGERDAPRMGERLRARGALPALVLSSHAKRARTTAMIVARALGLSPTTLRIEPALYLATSDEILRVLATRGGDSADAMIVGHNPGLTDLSNRLLPALQLDSLPTTGVVAIELAAEEWSELGNSEARLVYYDYPKNAERPAASA